jgi:hypothetical protein
VELEGCVELLESLKFWRSLANMSVLKRRIYYPVLHLREGGIRRTSLRRAARLEAMLSDRATKVMGLMMRIMVWPWMIDDYGGCVDNNLTHLD